MILTNDPKLAERAPVYAQLRNCIDLAVAAAFIQHQDYYGLVGWKPAVFESEEAYPVETLNPPQHVESAVNSLWKGNTLLTPIGGGVQMRPTEAIDPNNLLDDEGAAVQEARAAIDLAADALAQYSGLYRSAELESAFAVRVEDGRIVRVDEYRTTDEAIEAIRPRGG
jgi:hypothetical protein